MTDTETPTTTGVPLAKKLHIFRNGDGQFVGKRYILNSKRTRTFDAFLEELTNTVSGTFGAVRKVFTPTAGHRINSLQELEAYGGQNYVAAGQEKFNRINYLGIEEQVAIHNRRRNKHFMSESAASKFSSRTSSSSRQIVPVKHSRVQVSGRIRKIRNDPLILFVYPNGNDLESPHRIHISQRERQSWFQILDAITNTVKLQSWGGAIRKLFTLDGHAITTLYEIENNGYYVAAGQDRFIPRDYLHSKAGLSPRIERRVAPHGMKLTPLRKAAGSSDRSAESSIPSSNNSDNKNTRRPRKTKEETGGIPARPVRVKRTPPDGSKPVDYDKDAGGMYKAKHGNNETRGAEEVPDTRDTQVDLPVDQREAETVEDVEAGGHHGPASQQHETDGEARASQSRRRSSDRSRQTSAKKQSDVSDEEKNANEEEQPAPKNKKKTSSGSRKKSAGNKADEEPPSKPSKQKYKDEDEAATAIQATFRGHSTRQKLKHAKSSNQQQSFESEDGKYGAGYFSQASSTDQVKNTDETNDNNDEDDQLVTSTQDDTNTDYQYHPEQDNNTNYQAQSQPDDRENASLHENINEEFNSSSNIDNNADTQSLKSSQLPNDNVNEGKNLANGNAHHLEQRPVDESHEY